jgi:hypothetical protein
MRRAGQRHILGARLTVAMFVHLAPESRCALIQRNGIRRMRKRSGTFPGGIFAVPVVRNFYISHQWLRELKRRNAGPLVGVYFRIPDKEQVWVGHYGQNHRWMSAAEAVREFHAAADPHGWEVVISRCIEPNEIRRVRHLPQVVGWRFYPGAKGRKPCPCRFCSRGDYGARKMRKRLGSPDD